MNDEQLSQVLERIAEKAVPEGTSIWDKLEASYQAEVQPKRRAIPLNWAAIFLVIFGISLLTTGGALAYILLRGFPSDPGGQNVAEAGLGIAINQSQTINGVTLNLVQGYADEERILLFYTIEGIDPTRFNRRAPEAELNEVWTLDGLDHYQTIDALHYHYRRDEGKVLLVSSIRSEAQAGETLEFRWQLIVNNLGEVAPPEFHFDLRLPVVESLIIPVNQTVEVEGLSITLETIQLGAASSQVRLCTTLPEGYADAEFNDMGLIIDGTLYPYVSEQNIFEGRRYCLEQSFDAGILTGAESIEVTFSGLMIAPLPSQAEIENAIAELAAVDIDAEITLVDGLVQWEVLSNPRDYNAEVWVESTLYNYQQIQYNHTFSINLSDIVLAKR